MFLRSSALAVLFVVPFYAAALPGEVRAGRRRAARRTRASSTATSRQSADATRLLAHKSMHAKGTLAVPASGITGPDRDLRRRQPGSRDREDVGARASARSWKGSTAPTRWMMSPMTGPMLKVARNCSRRSSTRDFYSELRDPKKYLSVKTVEKTTFDGRPCYKVALTPHRRRGGLRLLRRRHRAPRRQHQHPRVADGHDDDRPARSAATRSSATCSSSTTQSQKVMGVEQTITLTSVEFDKVDPAVFTPPAAIKALIK